MVASARDRVNRHSTLDGFPFLRYRISQSTDFVAEISDKQHRKELAMPPISSSLLRSFSLLQSRARFLAATLASFAAGSLLTAHFLRPQPVRAEGDRVFELMVYHTLPGKVPALESIFRDVSKMQEKYNLKVIGYWVPNEDAAWSNTFIYLVAHPSRDDAKKNWHALHADPAFPPYREAAAQILEKSKDDYHVDEIYMRPSDFSALK